MRSLHMRTELTNGAEVPMVTIIILEPEELAVLVDTHTLVTEGSTIEPYVFLVTEDTAGASDRMQEVLATVSAKRNVPFESWTIGDPA